MKRLGICLLAAALAASAYTYYYSDTLATVDSTKWWQNGSVTGTSGGLTATSTDGGSLISKVSVPDGTSEYEVKTTLTLAASGGYYTQYLRASSDARLATTSTGTFWAAELQNPSISGSVCTATLVLYKRVSGTLTLVSSAAAKCRSGMTMRSVSTWNGQVVVYLDDEFSLWAQDAAFPAGQPGIGARQTPTGNSVARVDLGPLDRTPPFTPNAQSISSSLLSNEVNLQWQPPADDVPGIGIMKYDMCRDGFSLLWQGRYPEFTDSTVAPSTSYTYTIFYKDFHLNVSNPVSVTVTTLSSGFKEARRIGLRSTGTFWGASPEQIDMLSGNLNATLPLLKVMGRGGWGAGFALSYNSQNWKRDGSVDWKLGRDVGYGFGWKLQAGSLTPYWNDYWTLHHYLFVDSTGAEYRLDVNTGGIWTSKESICVEYDANQQRLYFPDGSFWVMGSISGGTEQDAGSRYPTLMQDTNGNQVKIRYQAGVGTTLADSSARINEIEDVRAVNISGVYRSYLFNYNTDAIPHLTSIQTNIGSGENWAFTYTSGAALASPFTSTSYGTTSFLSGVDNTSVGQGYDFFHSTAGELTQINLPKGGSLRWNYRTFTFAAGRAIREIDYRYLSKQSGGTETTYHIWRDDAADASRNFHWASAIIDPTNAEKDYSFGGTGGGWQLGLVTVITDRPGSGLPTARRQDFTWVQDAAGNPSISSVLTTLDEGQTYQKQSKREQTIDTHGNVTQVKMYDFGNLTTPARVYDNTYANASALTSRHIWNRLASSVLSSGGQSVTLVSNSYDGYGNPVCAALSNVDQPQNLREHDSANYGTGFTARGNVTVSTGPGVWQCFSYNVTGAVTAATVNNQVFTATQSAAYNYAAPSAISGSGDSGTYAYNTALGLTQATGTNSESLLISYDAAARPSQTTSPFGAVTTYGYGTNFTSATTNGHFTQTTLDGLGRTIRAESGDGSGTKTVVDTEYDSCACSPVGKVKRVSQPHAPGAGTLYWTTYSYDSIGRTVSVSLPDSTGTVTYSYQGNVTTVTDPAGKWKKFTTDVFGNLTQVNEPNPAGGADYVTTYSYNLHNQLTGVSMPRGGVTQTRTFNYDLNTKRLTSATNPENGTVSYVYNTDGTLASKTDAKGQKITYEYNTNQKLTAVRRWVNATTESVCEKVIFAYGSAWPSINRLTSASWGTAAHPNCTPMPSWVESYTYNGPGAVTGKTLAMNTQSLTASYTYDNEGKATSVKYPDYQSWDGSFNHAPATVTGPTYNLTYDTMSRPATMRKSGAAIDTVKDVLYNVAGQMTQMRWLITPGGTAYYAGRHGVLQGDARVQQPAAVDADDDR